MKYRIFSMILIILISSLLFIINERNNEICVNTYSEFCICIDPGHGGVDGGAIKDNIKEKDINLIISNKLKKIFIDNNFKVVMTRNDDNHLPINSEFIKKRDLDERIKIINNCDLFISIHANKFELEYVNGAQVFYNINNHNSLILASIIQKEFYNDFNNTRNAKSIKDIYLLDNAMKPGTIVEVGFMSNEQEFINLQNGDYQNKIASCIYKGIFNYLNLY